MQFSQGWQPHSPLVRSRELHDAASSAVTATRKQLAKARNRNQVFFVLICQCSRVCTSLRAFLLSSPMRYGPLNAPLDGFFRCAQWSSPIKNCVSRRRVAIARRRLRRHQPSIWCSHSSKKNGTSRSATRRSTRCCRSAARAPGQMRGRPSRAITSRIGFAMLYVSLFPAKCRPIGALSAASSHSDPESPRRVVAAILI